MIIDIDHKKIIKLRDLMDAFSVQATEIMGCDVEFRVTSVQRKTSIHRNPEEEDMIISAVKRLACDIFSVSKADIVSKSSYARIKDARNMAYIIIRERIPLCPLKKIGMEFGMRDHSTVSSGIKSISALIESENHMKEIYAELKKQLVI